MKKFGLLSVCILATCLLLSACNYQPNNSMVKSERRLEKYFAPSTPQAGVIDLSEGPKLKYNAKFGPKDLNFDFKIENPYH